MLRVSNPEAIRSAVLYLYTVANNLVKEHAVLDRRQASGIDIEEVDTHEQLEFLPGFDRGSGYGAAGRAAAGRVEAVAPQMAGRGRASLHARSFLPRDRDPPGGVPADGEKVCDAGTGPLPTSHGAAPVNPMTPKDEQVRQQDRERVVRRERRAAARRPGIRRFRGVAQSVAASH